LLPGKPGRTHSANHRGRTHRLFDVLVARLCGDHGRMLDIACGFPPVTSVDSATALPGWDILGADRALPEFLLEDALATTHRSTAGEQVQYFQPTSADRENWAALLGDYDGSQRRLKALFRHLHGGAERRHRAPRSSGTR
jgi:hypothetical protein